MARKSRKAQLILDVPIETPAVRAALYIRLSVEDTHTKTVSIETQQMIIQQYLDRNPEITHCETYIDNGASGTTFQRPAFQQMLTDIEAGHINCVIVKDFSRLGRNAIDAGYYLEQYFPAHRVRFVAITDNYDSADPKCKDMGIIVPLKNMVNEAYALDIGRKIKAQQRQAMKNGEYIGARPPYGYFKAPDDCHRLVIDPVTAPVVRQIFQWAAEGIGVNPIAKMLNEQGIPSAGYYKRDIGVLTNERLAGSGAWQSRTVAQILHRELYTGNMVQGYTKMIDHKQIRASADNRIAVPNTHEAIVSQEMFDNVQSILKNAADKYKQKQAKPFTPNLFKGKIFCACCGRTLHRQRNTRKTMPEVYVFHCMTNSRVAKGTCKGVLIREDALLPAVSEILMKALDVYLDGELVSTSDTAAEPTDLQKLLAEKKMCQQKLTHCHERIRGLYENLVCGIIPSDDYTELKTQYEKTEFALKQTLEKIQSRLDKTDRLEKKRQALDSQRHTLKANPALTAELINRLIDRIEVDADKQMRIVFSFTNESGKDEVSK